ncbi:MAG: ribonuclease domain-containing protein [Aeromicrobium sp.]
MRRSTWWQVLGVLVVVAAVLWGAGRVGPDPDRPAAGAATSQLPVQARDTLELIDAGGPFPYDRDGAVFMNRERLLPRHERGFWREYTVPTPGESDRGPRRLVVGEDGSAYYTADHYRSFRQVREAAP